MLALDTDQFGCNASSVSGSLGDAGKKVEGRRATALIDFSDGSGNHCIPKYLNIDSKILAMTLSNRRTGDLVVPTASQSS
ncbi:hypothetical protein [Acidobacterium sp. S8]|uniref:hypothetical protein n=1 Tax=Acidobacterium sp. S8 TaxID=1641854 RepID=UPI00131C510D|nr:hypothetical protein [Acidobacterium sp. S8]